MEIARSRYLRPPEAIVRRLGQEWAESHNYKVYKSGKLKTRHGTWFDSVEQLGRLLIHECLVERNGQEYRIIKGEENDQN